MSDRVLFQMWEPYRQQLIAAHEFYVEKGKEKLLSQFENIEAESDEYADKWLEKRGQYFDPERHDPSDFYEQAYDKGIEFYGLLSDLRDRTCLSIIAGIFHEWDKALRDWLVHEVRHWSTGKEVQKAIWRVNFADVFELLDCLKWQPKTLAFYTSLDRCRLVVNAYKHGDGGALDDLKKSHPDFIDNPFASMGQQSVFWDVLGHQNLKVTDIHLDEFSNAIIEFWKAVPENTMVSDINSFPNWLEKAAKKDSNAGNTS